MADYLVYWKKYWDDIEDPRETIHDRHTNSRNFYRNVKRGDILWVVTTDKENPAKWVLLQRIHISRREVQQPAASRYGKYHLIGDNRKSELFDPRVQPDFTAILWLLGFSRGKRIRVLGRRIGLALQSHGFRQLSEKDAELLKNYGEVLKRIRRR